MNIDTTSVPAANRATDHGARRLIVGGGALLLVGGLLAGVWTYSSVDSAPAPVPAPAHAAPARSAATVGRSSSTADRAHTVYIVSSEESATTIRAEIDETNAILAATSERPFLASVIVAPSGADAAMAMQAIFEGNRILAGLGKPEDRVIDLRGD